MAAHARLDRMSGMSLYPYFMNKRIAAANVIAERARKIGGTTFQPMMPSSTVTA
jgi:hypothetical protein